MAGGTAALTTADAATAAKQPKQAQLSDRAYMAGLLQKMAEPILVNMAKGELKKAFPIEVAPTWDGRDKNVAHMEAFGRLMAGAAPWLSLPDTATPEGQVRKRLTAAAVQAYVHSVDPNSPDYLLWRGHGQALVDSAFFTNALMRASKQLWEPLDATTQKRVVEEIKGLRRVSPPYTNWLLFAAMNEAFLLMIGEDWDPMRVDLAVKKMEEWYVGDGWVADGSKFHFDYYNSYVIYPMLVEILEVLKAYDAKFNNLKPADELAKWLKRMQRYGEHLERFVSSTGTYPPIGRSLTYRTAVFQPLGLLAWRKSLPPSLAEGQVRAAITAAHKSIFTDPSNFTADGYLTIGFAGHQPTLGDRYSNNGSMYITSEGFVSLGLAEDDSYWTSPAQDWTQKKAFSNQTFPKDYAVDY
ncbi:hypothetical protein ABI_01670 [Asticcacaulis biprosthecium C19]|uniref:DUF2264 domain-containing protein n=2 Tax=Asticcacaulis biprosthecium TaxID=76891 RepID=F4QI99_9CAUL|nr:hypothetical protein ABI_01670 [Asticcacaulis biprosthecium C19]